MKITLYMAMSVNGMIARKNGEEDFLSHKNWEKFVSLANEHKNFVVGRKTYEAVKRWGEDYSFDDLVGIEKVVISKNTSQKLDEGYTLADSPKDAIAKLSKKGFENILVTGGATINSSFAKEKLLDEIILNIEPVFIEQGIPLFSENSFDIRLELVDTEKNGDRLTLHYKVLK